MPAAPNGPLIVQSDHSMLLEVNHPDYEAARDALAPFAELQKSPEHMHTYRLTPISLWNAAAAGLGAVEAVAVLEQFARYGVPENVSAEVIELMGRYGKLRLVPSNGRLALESEDSNLLTLLGNHRDLRELIRRDPSDGHLSVDPLQRGAVKLKLARIGYPIDDRVGFAESEALDFQLRSETQAGKAFAPRDYQQAAVDAFAAAGKQHGVIVLPCGSGKTIVGMMAAEELSATTLILCTNVSAARQWIDELLDKTTLTEDQVGEYTGRSKQVRPVTVTTYQILSRRSKGEFTHLGLFSSRSWGLIIYDEVHLLPAPVFRVTAEIQSRRRLGLTATLVREDGRETDVFSLIGPKRYDVPWKVMEKTGFIAEATCFEIRVPMSADLQNRYALSSGEPRAQYRLAAENAAKDRVVAELVEQHEGQGILVIGRYLKQLDRLARRLGAPVITGKVLQRDREKLFDAFRRGEVTTLILSNVANFSIDLPSAEVCIQVSGTYGSRQEEAQRLGRILRPKESPVSFYTLVSHNTEEMRFARNRQLFLTEQGYRYYIEQRKPGAEMSDEFEAAEPTPPTQKSGLADVIPFPGRAS